MRIRLLLAALLVLTFASVAGAVPRKIDDIRTGTYANRGTCTAGVGSAITYGDGERYRVTDAASTACSAGGGSTVCTLICQDGAWAKIGSGGGGTPAFSGITGGTNSTATMVVGTGASVSPSGTGQIVSTSGDTATSFFPSGAVEVARGGTGAAPGAGDQVLVSDGTTAATWRSLADCATSTSKLLYDAASNTFSCGTDVFGTMPELASPPATPAANLASLWLDDTSTDRRLYWKDDLGAVQAAIPAPANGAPQAAGTLVQFAADGMHTQAYTPLTALGSLTGLDDPSLFATWNEFFVSVNGDPNTATACAAGEVNRKIVYDTSPPGTLPDLIWRCAKSGTPGKWQQIGAQEARTETMLLALGYTITAGQVVVHARDTVSVDGTRIALPADLASFYEYPVAGVVFANADSSVAVAPVRVATKGEHAYDTSGLDLFAALCVTGAGYMDICGNVDASPVLVAIVTVVGTSPTGRIFIVPHEATISQEQRIDYSAINAAPVDPYDWTAGGCATGLGCNTGSFFVIDPKVWDNSPGVRHSTTGQSFSTYTGTPVAAGDSPNHLNAAANEVATVQSGLTWSNCSTAASGVQYCTTLASAFTDEADKFFCRNNTTPFAECSTGATCVSAIAGADDPETMIVRHANAINAGEFNHTPLYVTAYTGCNSATNTLTVLPFQSIKTGTVLDRMVSGDTMQAAMNDNVHPGTHYGHLLAESILKGTVTESFRPRANLVATGKMDTESDCDTGINAVSGGSAAGYTSGTNLIPYDPTKAGYLGGWSATSGGACKYVGAGSDFVQLPAFAVTPGAMYSCSFRTGKAALAAPTYRVRDQANTAIDATWKATVRGGRGLFETLAGFVSSYSPAAGADAGWIEVEGKFQGTETSTTARIEIAFNSTTANYVDDVNCSLAPDPAIWPTPLIPPGKHKILVATDSRGDTTSGNLATALKEAAPILRPDLSLQIDANVSGGRQLSTTFFCDDPLASNCWNYPDRAQSLARQGYNYVVMWHGVNDAFTGLKPPAETMQRMMEAVAAFRQVGITVLWVKEPPIMGNSTFGSLTGRCKDANGSTQLSCALHLERTMRFLSARAD